MEFSFAALPLTDPTILGKDMPENQGYQGYIFINVW